MCGRFTQKLSSSEFAAIFGARDLAETSGEAYNVAPTQGIVSIRERRVEAHGDAAGVGEAAAERAVERVAERLRWGLVPSWSDGPDPRGRLINARAETVATSPAFRGSFRSKRCIVPVDGFYEWQRTDGKSRPFYITSADGRPLAFAGLWSAWKDPSTDLFLVSCAVITTSPNELMAPIHGRMPVILPPEAWSTWLGAEAGPDELQGLLRPSAAELVAWPVASLVNNPRHQGADLIRPLPAGFFEEVPAAG